MHEVSLEARRWNLTANMHHGPGGPRALVDYEYTGTGAPGGNEVATLEVPVQPGKIYVFSSWVDPSKISDGQFDLIIDTADGKSTYSITYGSAGPPLRYSTPPWLCPPGVTRVMLGLQANGLTLARGQKLKFSEPALAELSAISAAQPPAARAGMSR